MPNSARLQLDVVVQPAIAGVQQHLGAGLLGDRAGAEHVIEVGVGVNQLDRLHAQPLEPREDVGRLIAGVDDDRLLGVGVGDDRAVAAEQADGE